MVYMFTTNGLLYKYSCYTIDHHYSEVHWFRFFLTYNSRFQNYIG